MDFHCTWNIIRIEDTFDVYSAYKEFTILQGIKPGKAHTSACMDICTHICVLPHTN